MLCVGTRAVQGHADLIPCLMGKWRPSPTSLYFECSGMSYCRLFIQVLTLGCTAGIDVIIAFFLTTYMTSCPINTHCDNEHSIILA